MKSTWLAFFLLLTTAANTRAASITLDNEINAGAGLGNQYQSDLRCNPLDIRQMLITSKLGNSETETVAFHTADGGATWTSFRQPSSGDPDSVYDLNGWVHWSIIDKVGGKTTGYRRSKDGGKTWEEKRQLGAAIDHLHIACDRSAASPNRNSLYIAGRKFSGGGIVVLRSRDGGETFQPTTVALSGSLGLGFVFAPVVLADGTLLIPMQTANNFLTDGRGWYAGNLKEIYCLRSTDGGLTFQAPVKIADKISPAVKGAGGASVLGGMVAGTWGGGQRVYMTWPMDQSNAPATLMLTTSDDGGQTWSSSRCIAPQAPAGWGAGAPSTLVNAAGTVGVQWYSMKDDRTFDLYFTASTDGGATFGDPVRISPATSTEPPKQPRYPGQDQVYGDTAADGSFKLVWTDARNTAATYTNYVRSVTVTAGVPATPSTLTVTGGSGGGVYEVETRVAITAAAAPAGQEFAGWTSTAGWTVTPANAPIATVTTLAGAGIVTANWRPQTLHALIVVNGSGDGSYAAGTLVTITADAVPGSVFAAWTGPDGVGMLKPKAATTQVMMPSSDATFTATYKKTP